MNEPVSSGFQADGPQGPAAGGGADTAGSLLRQARQARGLHVAALAASIKVTPRKLEMLEADRFDELPGAAFTRALAQTVCRVLKVDAGPVLALLPAAPGHGLDRMSQGINTPFRDRPGRQLPNDFAFLKSPVGLGALALVVLAVGVYLLPDGWIGERLALRSGPAAAADASSASAPDARDPDAPVMPPDGTASTVIETVHTAPGEPAGPGADVPLLPATGVAVSSGPATAASPASGGLPVAQATASAPASTAPVAPAAASGVVVVRTTAASWVEVVDRRGAPLLSRMLQPGEAVGLDGTPPFRVKVGNAQGTEVTFKGAPVDLASRTRDNVARFELQ